MFGGSHLQVAGNIGYGLQSDLACDWLPHELQSGRLAGPAVKLTMQQVSLPTRVSQRLFGGAQANAPALRTMSLTFIERTEVADGIHLEYGASLDSVTFVDRLNYLSPFARLTYILATWEVADGLQFRRAASGVTARSSQTEVDADLQRDMMALAVLPRVSLRGGRAMVQRSQNMEIGYEVEIGSRTFNVAAFREVRGNGALTMSTPDGFSMTGDLLPELSSSSSVFNIGRYERLGYSATVTQQIR